MIMPSAAVCVRTVRVTSKVGDTAWTWITVSADPTGKKYAYAELPVEGLGWHVSVLF